MVEVAYPTSIDVIGVEQTQKSQLSSALSTSNPDITHFTLDLTNNITPSTTMSSAIPTAASVVESAVIDAPLSQVWHLIKLQDFGKFWSKLDKSDWIKGASPDTDLVKWTFKDGTVLDVKQEEHSTINHYITYSVITASPELTYTSVLSTIRLYPITSGKHEGSTFVTWSGHFSSDADAGVIEDAKFKRREALADLAAAVSK